MQSKDREYRATKSASRYSSLTENQEKKNPKHNPLTKSSTDQRGRSTATAHYTNGTVELREC